MPELASSSGVGTRRILVDLRPAAGAHGQRGIGTYVRGLRTAISSDPWLGERTIRLEHGSRWTGLRDQDVGWLSGWLADSHALRRAGASVIHQTDPRRPLRPGGARKTAVTAYDLIPLEPEHRAAERWHRRRIYRAYLVALRRADRVVAISEATAAVVAERLGIRRERIDVVYPVVTVNAMDPDRRPAVDATFLFVGVPDVHKRPELAIQALAAFRGLHGVGRLRFVGPAAPAHLDRIQAEARRWGVTDHVMIDGAVPPATLAAAYSEAWALLAVSRVEGFGLPPVEAALRGVPVVAIATPVARETLGEAALFVDDTPDALAVGMSQARPASAEARSSLAERYAPPAVAAQLRRCYQLLLDE